MQPLVSIIIPCFNAEKFVKDAIESALAQTYPAKEIIAVDDGSTDKTLEVLQSYGLRIRVLSGPNRGGCHARNLGLAESSGSIIQFLDADDLLKPNKLEVQVPILLQEPRQTVYSDVEVISMDSGERLKLLTVESRDPFRRVCFDQIQTSAPIHYKCDLIKIGGFRESLPCAQEKDFHVRLACVGISFKHLPGILAVQRRRSGSVSSDYSRVLLQFPDIVAKAVDVLIANNAVTEDRLRILAELLAYSGLQLAKNGVNESASVCFKQASSLHSSGGLSTFSSPLRVLAKLVGPVNAVRIRSLLVR